MTTWSMKSWTAVDNEIGWASIDAGGCDALVELNDCYKSRVEILSIFRHTEVKEHDA